MERFGSARDAWIAADLSSWLAPNRIYSGVAPVLRSLKQREDVYIVTTKQVGSSPATRTPDDGPQALRVYALKS